MLLPALKSAKERAKLIHCTTKSKNMASAMMMYTMDNENDLPPDYNWKSHSNWRYRNQRWTDYIYAYLGLSGSITPYQNCSIDVDHPREPFFCPSENNTHARHYGMNYYVSQNSSDKKRCRTITKVSDPAGRSMFMDRENVGAYAGQPWISQTYTVYKLKRHHGKRNVSFIDGHVELFTNKEIPTSRYKYFWGYYPSIYGW